MKDLAGRFSEAERRVRLLADENGRLHGRVRELEQQLASALQAAGELERFQGAKDEVRSRLERIQSLLDAITAEARPQEHPAKEG